MLPSLWAEVSAGRRYWRTSAARRRRRSSFSTRPREEGAFIGGPASSSNMLIPVRQHLRVVLEVEVGAAAEPEAARLASQRPHDAPAGALDLVDGRGVASRHSTRPFDNAWIELMWKAS